MSNPQQLLQDGIAHQKSGNLELAEQSYQSLLQVAPNDINALNLLGMIANSRQAYDEAIDYLQKAVTAEPKFADAYNNLGIAYKAKGEFQKSTQTFATAISLKPDDPKILFNLGNTYQNLAQYDKAEEYYRKALKLKPDFFHALYNLGVALDFQSRQDEAIPIFLKAVELNPTHGMSYYFLGRLYHFQNDMAKAISCLCFACKYMPDHEKSFKLFKSLNHNLIIKNYKPAIVEQYVACMQSTFVQHRSLSPGASHQLTVIPECQAAFDGILSSSRNHELIEAMLEDESWQKALHHPLLIALIRTTMVTNHTLEQVLTILRKALLDYITQHGTEKLEPLRLFIYALADQHFINEYIYNVTEEETKQLATLTEQVQTALDNNDVDWLHVTMLASYAPLFTYEFAEKLTKLAQTTDDQEVAYLIREQVAEPLEEQTIKVEISAFDHLDDEVTQAVKDQYEDLPFPRWKTMLDHEPMSVKEFINIHFKYFDMDSVDANINMEQPDILIAGCGTGQQAVNCRGQFNYGSLTAIDLSSASLAYAIRKTREKNIHDIDFQHYNILELSNWDRQFDYVECFGVMHHLSNPEQGLENLLSVLKPGGFLMLGLYSKIAREPISAAWDYIAKEGFPSTLQGMRACRQAIFDLPEGDKVRLTAEPGSAFWTASDVRDLIFHENEYQYNLLDIKEMLENYDLEFMGLLDVPLAKTKEYEAIYPGDPDRRSLENWDKFEQDNPILFGNCYKFWIRKPM